MSDNDDPIGIEHELAPFAPLPHPIIRHMAIIGRNAYDVYGALLLFCGNRDKTCWPSIKTLMGITGMSAPTFKAAMRRLKELGLVESRQDRRDGEYGVNLYRIKAVYADWKPTEVKNLAHGAEVKNFDYGTEVKNFDYGTEVKNFAHKLDPVLSLELDKDKEETVFDCFSDVTLKTSQSDPPQKRSKSRPIKKPREPLDENDWLRVSLKKNLPDYVPFEPFDDQDYWALISKAAQPPFLCKEWLEPHLNRIALWLDGKPHRRSRSDEGWRRFVKAWLIRELDKGR